MVIDCYREAEIGVLIALNDALHGAGLVNDRLYETVNKMQRGKLTGLLGSDMMDLREKTK